MFVALDIETKEFICNGFDRTNAEVNARHITKHWARVAPYCVRPVDNPELNRQALDVLTDNNMHTERGILAAELLDTAHGACIAGVLREVKARHELAGCMNRQDQTLRDALTKEAEDYLKIMGRL